MEILILVYWSIEFLLVEQAKKKFDAIHVTRSINKFTDTTIDMKVLLIVKINRATVTTPKARSYDALKLPFPLITAHRVALQ